MSVTVPRAALSSTLAWCARALPSRPTLPVLAGIRIVVEDGVLTASSYDYDQSAAGTLEVEGDNLSVLVSGKLLADIVRSLSGDTVVFVLEDDNSHLKVTSGRSTFRLPLLPLLDYPSLPSVPPRLGTISGTALADAIRQVAAAAGSDTSLPLLTAVNITAYPAEGHLTLAATDRYRLAVTEVPYSPEDPTEDERTFLVPAKLLESYSKNFTDSEQVTLHQGEEQQGLFGITGNSLTATTRLLEGQFPNYQPLLPKTFVAEVDIPKQEFIDAVKRVTLVADRSQSIRLQFEQGLLTIMTAGGTDAAQSAMEEIEVEYEGAEEGEDELAINFNPTYLLDGLAHIRTSLVTMQLVSSIKPALLINKEVDDPFQYLLMPIRA